MVTIRIVSWIHLCWGTTMLALDYVPRPFGSLEPFLQFMPVRELGVFLVVTALLALTATHWPRIYVKWPMVVPLAAVPQQALLVWGVAWAILTIFGGETHTWLEEARTWYGCSYQTVLATFHMTSMYQMYKLAMIKSEVVSHAHRRN